MLFVHAQVIEHSLELTRAAERIQELQRHVDTLTTRLTGAMQVRTWAMQVRTGAMQVCRGSNTGVGIKALLGRNVSTHRG